MESIFASTHNTLTDNGLSEGVKDGKPDTPVHPGEKPSKVAHKKWAATWRASLTTLGYGSFLRGDVPVDIKKLAAVVSIAKVDFSKQGRTSRS